MTKCWNPIQKEKFKFHYIYMNDICFMLFTVYNKAVSSSNYLAPNGRLTNEIERMQSGYGFNWDRILVFTSRDEENHKKPQSG
jgi:hypothetical protein